MKRFFLYWALLCSFNAYSEGQAFTNALFFNHQTNQAEQVSFIIQDGTFALVTKDELPPEYEPIDLAGSLVVPGMIDMHTHGWGNSGLRTNDDYQYIGIRGTSNAMLYAGVHGWLDLFNDEARILNYRDQQFHTERDESYVFAAGPCFTVTNGHCSFGRPTRIIDSPEDVEREVNALMARKPNVLKVVYHTKNEAPTISEATLQTFLEKAEAVGVPSVVHVGNWDDVRAAAKFGASAVTHVPWTPMPEDIPMLMKNNNTAMIPTVGLLAELLLLKEQRELPESAQELTDVLVDEILLQQFPLKGQNESYMTWVEKHENAGALWNMANSLSLLSKHGVKLLVGSDAANEAMYQGIGMHRELAHLQAMGFPVSELLKAATYNAYQFLGINWGIKKGAPANFIVVDPLATKDIEYLTQIKSIYLHGREVNRSELLKYAKPGWIQYAKLFLGFED